jgi:hypothetical protein
MTTIILLLSALASILGVIVSVWSLIITRKKYYQEYIQRKRNE